MSATDESGVVTLGAGCFWCVEAVFEELEGVTSVTSGYMGGTVDNPKYREVCSGDTGHAEVCRIKFDPEKISFQKLLEVFFVTHNPTTLNRQGGDVGTEYRSVIFYYNEEQRQLAELIKEKLDESGAFSRPIVTEISPASTFWPAEDYHQDYFATNPKRGYCRAVIAPKMKKFRRVFADDLK